MHEHLRTRHSARDQGGRDQVAHGGAASRGAVTNKHGGGAPRCCTESDRSFKPTEQPGGTAWQQARGPVEGGCCLRWCLPPEEGALANMGRATRRQEGNYGSCASKWNSLVRLLDA